MLDDDGVVQPYGAPGEVSVRGPQVMKGYWRRPEDTATVLTSGGFFRTGDIGIMSDQGRVRLLERKTDLIMVSGYNVFLAEVGVVAAALPGVLDCVEVGVPDALNGDALKMQVVGKDQPRNAPALP